MAHSAVKPTISRVPERPRPAPKVAAVLHLEAGFFKYLAPDALLNRFLRFHETGKDAVKLSPEPGSARQKQLPIPNHRNNHGRSQTRVLVVTARGTVPARGVPIDNLDRPAEQTKLNVTDLGSAGNRAPDLFETTAVSLSATRINNGLPAGDPARDPTGGPAGSR